MKGAADAENCIINRPMFVREEKTWYFSRSMQTQCFTPFQPYRIILGKMAQNPIYIGVPPPEQGD